MAVTRQRVRGAAASWKFHIPVLLVAVLGIALSLGLWSYLDHKMHERSDAVAASAVDDTALRAGESLGQLRGAMLALQTAFQVSPNMTEAQFRDFARAIMAEASDEVSVYYAPVADSSLPVQYRFPATNATVGYGEDLLAIPGLDDGIRMAQRTGTTYVQALAADPANAGPELVATTPVLAPDKRTPAGAITAVVPVKVWMDIASATTDPQEAALMLYSVQRGQNRLAWTNSGQPAILDPAGWTAKSTLALSEDESYVLAGEPTNALMQKQGPWQSWAGLLAGLILTGIVSALLWRWLDARRISRTADDLQQATNRLLFLAERDPLTGLPHRDGLLGWLEDWDQRHPDRSLGLLYIDLDGFKDVNTAWGHPTGDLVLRQIGQRLAVFADDHDCTVARLGGDEFVVMRAMDRGSLDGLAAMAQAVISEPISFGDRDIQLTSSMGIAVRPEDGRTLDTLLMNADIAVRAAKLDPNDSVVHYDPAMGAESVSRRKMARELRVALRDPREHFFLVYQPQIDMRTGRLVGTESLLRWRDAAGVLVPPSDFIRCAREYGLMERVGRWVLEEACTTVADWRRSCPATISVNVDATQLTEGFSAMVGAILQRRGVDPSWLVMEVTESAAMKPEAQAELDRLRDFGLSISIDDFGTGFSSLSRLADLPTHELKIDRAFVQGLGESPEPLEIVRTVVALAQALSLQTLAEGVETPQQADILLAEGVNIAQGYLFAKPMDSEHCLELWRTGVQMPVRRESGSS